MSQEYTAFYEVEYLLGPCQDEEDAAVKAAELLENIKYNDLDVNTISLIEVAESEW